MMYMPDTQGCSLVAPHRHKIIKISYFILK